MDTKNNSDSEKTFPINFHPMPERFMVWDIKKKEFVKSIDTFDYYISSYIHTETTRIMEFMDNPEFIVIQSTNQFDKDGKEIFEGSIVVDYDDEVGVVYYDNDKGQYRAEFTNGDDSDMEAPSLMEVIGHILSNPELLEKK